MRDTEIPQEHPDANVPINGSEGDVDSHEFSADVPPSAERKAEIRRRPGRQRRILLPIILFVATCYCTFQAGALHFGEWDPRTIGIPADEREFLLNQSGGWQYMLALIGILLAHEMGHFVMTLRHHVPASLPFFIPVPFSLIGTMGAVIGMDGRVADRRQLFDIGIAGPIAGLVIAMPVVCVGIIQAKSFPANAIAAETYHDPLVVKLLIPVLRPDLPADAELLLSPLLMAGWVGLLITGLNMMPVSQLDGGHVIYGLFGKKAHWIARAFLMAAVAYVIIAKVYLWTLMIVLVALMGTDHPPTANDRAALGPYRWAIGLASLAIPVLCFPPRGISIGPMG